MATLSLKIHVVDRNVTKTMQLEPYLQAYDACRVIRDKCSEYKLGDGKDYGLFLSDEDPKKGVWLEPGRALEYYLLRDGDLLEYRRKTRPLRVRMLDGSVKTVLVDDSQPIANLLVVICTKIGISNHDEFSLLRDDIIDSKENQNGTLTLRKEKMDQKMEQLKKKLKTDDDLNWVDHSKTLREQGIDEEETLLLRRKFFFSDQNVDSRDPVQLNLLYVQARDAIINGTHPVTVDKGAQFAGLQCQIQFGDHIDTKHKPGFLDVKDFTPKDFCKIKTIEKKIFSEHRLAGGLSELDAKVKYVSLARSLTTYGVAFFLVKEKMKGKNKLVPRLLGVTKDSVLRLDEKTKEIMKTWPLTTVKRWAASPNSFTLDFGDYSDSYYSVQTPEGEQISQLIAGYIDIILKKKKARDHFGIEGDDGSTLVEDSVSPAKATILQHHNPPQPSPIDTDSISKPAIVRTGVDAEKPFGMGQIKAPLHSDTTGQIHAGYSPVQPQHPRVHTPLSEPQKALLGCIDAGQNAIDLAQRELQYKAQLPELGTDPASMQWKQNTRDVKTQNVTSQLGAMNAATAQVITLTSGPPEDVDHPRVGAAITTITTNLPEMAKDVKMIAALMDDDLLGDRLLDAARILCVHFSDLLRAAEPESREPRQNLLSAASKVGEATHAVLHTIGDQDPIDKEIQDMLISLAKRVANATANLVLKAKNVASKCDDPLLRDNLFDAATQCALATSQLVACAKVVAPTISNPACQQQMVEATKEVAKAVDGIITACQMTNPDENLLKDTNISAKKVNDSLTDLLNYIRVIPDRYSQRTGHDGAVDTILDATDRLFSSTGDANEMVRQAKILTKATSHLITAIRGEADSEPDSDLRQRLIAATKMLAEATSRMVEAAKGCATNPHDSESQDALRRAAEELRNATNAAASNALKRKLINRLEAAAKHAAAMATQNIAAAQGARAYNLNQTSQNELHDACKDVVEVIPRVVQGIKGTVADPDNSSTQISLISSCEQFIIPCTNMINASRVTLPTVQDQASALQLSNASRQMADALADLRSQLVRARDACGNREVEESLSIMKELELELIAFKRAAHNQDLRPLPGDSSEGSALQLGAISKVVGSSMAQLLTAAAQGNENYTGIASRDTANALKILTKAVRGVAACSDDLDVQLRILESAREVMSKAVILVEETMNAVKDPTNPDNHNRLTQVAKAVSMALNNCVNCLPGQKDVDEAIRNITNLSSALNTLAFPRTTSSYTELQMNLSRAAAELNEASTNVVSASKTSPSHLASSAKNFGHAFSHLMDSGMKMAGQTSDTDTRSHIVSSMKNVSMVSSKLLVAAKSYSADPSAPNSKSQLSSAARAVTDSINALIDICTSAAPGQKECDNAIRKIQSLQPLLDNPNEPVSDASYFECLDIVVEKSKSLGDGMTRIANSAKQGHRDNFCEAVRDVSDSICSLIEAGAQSAYLVGIADPSSVAGRHGLVDPVQFARSSQAIQSACQQLSHPSITHNQVLSAAAIIAKHTSGLCNSCRLASSKTNNPVAKRHFVQSAKDVANATAILVKEIKALDQESTNTNKKNLANATRPLIDAVENLCLFGSSPEFASIPGKIGLKARASQEPITYAGKGIIDSSCHMIQAAKCLAVNPKDPPIWQQLANQSSNVSDAIKQLVASIRDKAPGQKECDEALNRININIRELDKASVNIISQNLSPTPGSSLKVFQDQMESCVSELLEKIHFVRTAAKTEAERLGHAVIQLVNLYESLVHNAIGSASKTLNNKQQMSVLDQTKTVGECALQLVMASKEAGGNAKAKHMFGEIDDASESMKEVLNELRATLETAASEVGMVTGLVESINKSIVKVEEYYSYQSSSTMTSESFVDYQTRMVASCKEIARIAQDIVSKSTSDKPHLSPLASKLSHYYSNLSTDTRGAVASSANPDVGSRIRSIVQELGTACIHLTKAAGSLQSDPSDQYCQREVSEHARTVSEKVSYVMAALQQGSRGTQACISAASTVSGIIGDLDTTIMFASAGTLNPENEGDSFAEYRENILRTAKALVEDTKALVTGAASSQEQLAIAAQNSVQTILQLAEIVKLGAASLGSNNPETQVMLINAVKDVAIALRDLIQSTKTAAGKGLSDPAMVQLKDSAKVMVTNVTSLLKTVKAVEDEHSRGTRALESTIEAIGQEIRAFDSPEAPVRKGTAEELVRVTKPVTLATAKAVSAGTSCKQDDVIVAANMGRKAITDLLTTGKSAAYSAESWEVRNKVMSSSRECSIHYRTLLEMVHRVVQKPTAAGKQELVNMSRTIATSVTDIVTSAEILKGTDWVDPDDPTVIAETELLGAANSIDAAARKLANLKPRQTIRQTDEDLNFDEMILEAAKSIAAATSALVKAASSAQRELVAAGRLSTQPLYTSDDGQWSEGLISAARLVAAATHSLVEAANALVQGHATEEKLISSAKQVASSTAQLLVACKVKADPNSHAMRRLQAAGNAVKKATDNLVKAAQQAIEHDEERSLIINKRMVGGIAQEIVAREEILRKERELEEAREKLAALRRAKYGNRPMEEYQGYGSL